MPHKVCRACVWDPGSIYLPPAPARILFTAAAPASTPCPSSPGGIQYAGKIHYLLHTPGQDNAPSGGLASCVCVCVPCDDADRTDRACLASKPKRTLLRVEGANGI